MDFVAVPAIVVVCYFVGLMIKTLGPSEELDKWIPVICGVCGAVLSIIAYFTIPGYIHAENWLVALVLGIISGLSATGANQIYKQFSEK